MEVVDLSIDFMRWVVGGLGVVLFTILGWYLAYLQRKTDKLEMEISELKQVQGDVRVRFANIESDLSAIKSNQLESAQRGRELKQLMIEIKDALLRKNIL